MIVLENMLTWVLRNPLKSACAVGITTGTCIYFRRRAKRDPVYQKLLSGSRPDLQQPTTFIHRPQVEKDMELFLPSALSGIIIGPPGNGKTYAIRELCNKHPKGVLYYEVTNPDELVTGLSQEIGMKKTHSILLSCIFRCYHLLPTDQTAGLVEVLHVLEHAANKYTQEHGEIPVLFIDGIEKLLKHNEKLCKALVLMISNRSLKLVLVSNDSTFVNFVHKTSSSALMRSLIYEVDDLNESEAMSYLIKRYGFSQDKAKKLVGCVGGRLAYLQNLWSLKYEILNDDDDDICGMVMRTLFPFGMDAERRCIVTRKPESIMILREIINKGSTSLCDLKNVDWKRILEAEKDMINSKIIRYDTEGKLTWYSKIHEHELHQYST